MFDEMAQIRGSLALLTSEPLAGSPSAAQSDRVCDLLGLRERVEAEVLRSIGQWDAEGCWGEDGAVSAASWLAQHAGLTRAAATRLVRASRLLRENEATAAAVASCAVSCAQLDTLATVTRNREDLYAEGEDALLTLAETLTPDVFVGAARQWRSLADDVLANEDAYAVHERRYLHASKTLFSTVRIDGELDLDGGETFLAALAATDGPDRDDREPEGRTGGQRNADNLVQLAAAYLAGDAGDETDETDARPQVSTSLVVDFDILMGRAPGNLHDARRRLEHLGPIAQETALRLACDTSVIRAVMAGRSEVLDLGRATRVVSRAQRRALVLRDCGCGFPGCDRPPKWCDAHHIWHWVSGGPTDIANLVLLCRRHHVMVHEGGWKLARGPDGRIVAHRPDGSELVLVA
jgi:Domain of unknown function (DUF222)/HNH endonuclease